MRPISLVLSLIIIGIGVYGLTLVGNSTGQGYWLGALIVGIIWFFADIIAIKRHKREKN